VSTVQCYTMFLTAQGNCNRWSQLAAVACVAATAVRGWRGTLELV
jgi:hypothetical protein